MTKKAPVAGSQASDEFLLAYGDALLQWSNLEVLLATWFRKVALIPSWEMAYSIFFSARSFQGRADMFTAAIDHMPDDVFWKAFARDAILKAIAYSSARNQIAHGFVSFDKSGNSTVSHPARYWLPGSITLNHLRAASDNFCELRRILWRAEKGLTKLKGGKPLEECHELLRLLPNEACSTQPSRKQRGRERQRQAALRSKKNNK